MAGHGRIEGEGLKALYIPNTVSAPVDLPVDSVGDFGGIGGQLVEPPIVETVIYKETQPKVGGIGDSSTHQFKYQSSVNEQQVSSHLHQFTNSTVETSLSTRNPSRR